VHDAVDGRELDATELRSRGVRLWRGWRLEGARYRFYARDLKWGEVGCALSHHAVWEEVARRRLARAIVAEDDVEFTPAFEELLTGALARLDDLVAAGRLAPPDLLYLGRKASRRVLPRRRATLPSPGRLLAGQACWPAREVCVDDPPSGVEVCAAAGGRTPCSPPASRAVTAPRRD